MTDCFQNFSKIYLVADAFKTIIGCAYNWYSMNKIWFKFSDKIFLKINERYRELKDCAINYF